MREEAAAAALTQVRDRHQEGAGDIQGYCLVCGLDWPCRTSAAASSTLADFAAAWWTRHLPIASREERVRREHEPDVVAEVVDDAIRMSPAPAVHLLRYLAEAVPPGSSPLQVGVGPLEDLLAIHARTLQTPDGEIVVQAIDEAARQSPQFRSALQSVYLGADLPREVRARLERFLND